MSWKKDWYSVPMDSAPVIRDDAAVAISAGQPHIDLTVLERVEALESFIIPFWEWFQSILASSQQEPQNDAQTRPGPCIRIAAPRAKIQAASLSKRQFAPQAGSGAGSSRRGQPAPLQNTKTARDYNVHNIRTEYHDDDHDHQHGDTDDDRDVHDDREVMTPVRDDREVRDGHGPGSAAGAGRRRDPQYQQRNTDEDYDEDYDRQRRVDPPGRSYRAIPPGRSYGPKSAGVHKRYRSRSPLRLRDRHD